MAITQRGVHLTEVSAPRRCFVFRLNRLYIPEIYLLVKFYHGDRADYNLSLHLKVTARRPVTKYSNLQFIEKHTTSYNNQNLAKNQISGFFKISSETEMC